MFPVSSEDHCAAGDLIVCHRYVSFSVLYVILCFTIGPTGSPVMAPTSISEIVGVTQAQIFNCVLMLHYMRLYESYLKSKVEEVVHLSEETYFGRYSGMQCTLVSQQQQIFYERGNPLQQTCLH